MKETPLLSKQDRDRYRAAVALDVDGVLRIREPLAGEKTEVIEVEITMTQDRYPWHFHQPPRWGPDGTYTDRHFFSAAGVRWVRSLLARGIDVRWCTTWDVFANVYFTGPLQLPELPVIASEPRRREMAVDWKIRSIAHATRGRPVLWVDDNGWEDGLRYAHTPRALTGYRGINTEIGISPPDVQAMDNWLALASTAEGQGELHRKWRRERDRQRRLDRLGATSSPEQTDFSGAPSR